MLYGGVPYLVGTPLYVLFDYCYRKDGDINRWMIE